MTTQPPSTEGGAIFVLEDSVASNDPCAVAYANFKFVVRLLHEQLTDDEIPEDSLTSYYVDYYAGQMRNGGFSQFVFNTKWNPRTVARVAHGLARIGATEHARDFEARRAWMSNVDASELEAFLSSSYFGSVPLRARLDTGLDAFFDMSEREDVVALNDTWLRSHPRLVACSGEALDAEVARLVALVPDHAERVTRARARAAARAPREHKLIHALCAAAGQTLDRIAGSDSAFEWDGRKTTAHRFFTDKGLHRMFELDGRATMLRGRTMEVVVTIDGSAVG